MLGSLKAPPPPLSHHLVLKDEVVKVSVQASAVSPLPVSEEAKSELAIAAVRLNVKLPVPLSVTLDILLPSRILAVKPLTLHQAFAAYCPVSVTGPVPAALLTVFARISDNGQVPRYCERHARGHCERPCGKRVIARRNRYIRVQRAFVGAEDVALAVCRVASVAVLTLEIACTARQTRYLKRAKRHYLKRIPRSRAACQHYVRAVACRVVHPSPKQMNAIHKYVQERGRVAARGECGLPCGRGERVSRLRGLWGGDVADVA